MLALLLKYKFYIAGLVGAIGLLFGLYTYALNKGIQQEKERKTREEIKMLAASVNQLKESIVAMKHTNDSLVMLVNRATIKVIEVDRVKDPLINKALANLDARLDSVGKVQLTELKNLYDDKLKARDDDIAIQAKLILSQRAIIARQDTTIAQQDSIISKQSTLTVHKKSFLKSVLTITGSLITGAIAALLLSKG